MQPKLPSDFIAAMAQYWLVFNLMFSNTPKCFSTELISSWVVHSTCGAWGHPSPCAAHCNLLVDLHEVPISPSFQPVEVHVDVVMALWWVSHSPCVVSYGDLHSAPPLKIINEDVKQGCTQYTMNWSSNNASWCVMGCSQYH